MAVQNTYLPTDGDLNQAKRKRAGEAMAIDAVPKQTSFDATNTPAARVQAGYSANPMIRQFQASNDRGAQNRATGQAMLSDNAQQTIARAAGGATDAAMQAGAVRSAQAATGTVDRSNPAQEPYPGAAALQNRSASLGEAVVTNAGRDAINSALTAQPRPVPGNPARAAQMQAQFDQPVTAGAGGQASYGSGGIGESPLSLGNVVRDAYSAVSRPLKAGVGTAGNLVTALTAVPIDAGRNAIIRRAGGDPSTAEGGDTKYQDMAFGTLKPRLDAVSGAYDSAANSLSSSVLSATGAAPLTQPSAPTPARSAVNTASPAGSETPSDAGAAPESPQSIASQYYATNIGTDSQGGQIVMSRGKNGVPEFSNDSVAQDGAQAMPVGGIGGQPLRTPGVSNLADDVPLEQRGSINNIGNGVGGFSQNTQGDAALALGRFERANQEREKMIQASRRGSIGEGGGRVTVVKDSARVPTRDDRLRARNDEQVARTEALRTQTQQGIMGDADKLITEQLNRQKTQQEITAGNTSAESQQRLEGLRAQMADTSLPEEQRQAAAQAYSALTVSAADRYMTVQGGTNEFGGKDASKVFDRLTGREIGGAQSGQARTSVSMSEVEATAKARNMSADEVVAALKEKGVSVAR